ncbi:MAG TPA: ADP-L-glycero-D-mannoheptose-6-epimerase, partial [Sulfuricurvum sp.]|nr:ADP-L-glycero-D-mannoheptose-6-epimerase [Sulfuricurvum sp.]
TAMDRPISIEYIDMPETIREKYQYYTCAECGKLRQTGFTEPMTPLEEGVRDYVRNHLNTASPHLENRRSTE